MSYTTAAQSAKTIRTALKAHDKTWTSKAISVRCRNFSMGSAVDVEIRRPGISLAIVEEIANRQEHVRRDAFGEILSGGNRYIHVKRSQECRDEMGASFLPAVLVAIDQIKDNYLILVDGAMDVRLGRDRGDIVVWSAGRSGRRIWESDENLSAIAFEVACAAEKAEELAEQRAQANAEIDSGVVIGDFQSA